MLNKVKTGRAFSEYFSKIISMIETLSDSISRYQEYEVMLSDNDRFQEALAALFYDTLVFLHKAKKILASRGQSPTFVLSIVLYEILISCLLGLRILCRSVWKSFENDFDDVISLIARREKSMEAEIQLAHHVHIQASLEKGARQQSLMEKSLMRIEVSFAAVFINLPPVCICC